MRFVVLPLRVSFHTLAVVQQTNFHTVYTQLWTRLCTNTAAWALPPRSCTRTQHGVRVTHSDRSVGHSSALDTRVSMCIVMYMPTRNVYVSDSDVSLFSEAGTIAGSLSAAIVEALRDYVNKHHRLTDGFQEIELKLSTDGVDRRVTFAGRRVVHLRRPDPKGTRIDTVYLTAKGQLAVATKVHRTLPEWSNQEDMWSDPKTWSRDFWVVGDKTLSVYPDVERLSQADSLLAQRVEAALKVSAVEVLDI